MLPKTIRERLRILPGSKMTVEIKDHEVMLRPQEERRALPITERISSLRLPVGDWDEMERETEMGRLE